MIKRVVIFFSVIAFSVLNTAASRPFLATIPVVDHRGEKACEAPAVSIRPVLDDAACIAELMRTWKQLQFSYPDAEIHLFYKKSFYGGSARSALKTAQDVADIYALNDKALPDAFMLFKAHVPASTDDDDIEEEIVEIVEESPYIPITRNGRFQAKLFLSMIDGAFIKEACKLFKKTGKRYLMSVVYENYVYVASDIEAALGFILTHNGVLGLPQALNIVNAV